jgi:hypothetical protein
MSNLRSAALRLLAAVTLSLGAGFALSGTAGAAPAPTPVQPVAAPIVCPIPLDAAAAIPRPCRPCPIYALDASIRPIWCPPCPIYYAAPATDTVRIIRPCPPPCPIYLTGDAAALTVYCPLPEW